MEINGNLRALAVSPDGKRIAAAVGLNAWKPDADELMKGKAVQIRSYDLANGQESTTEIADARMLQIAAFSPDLELVAGAFGKMAAPVYMDAGGGVWSITDCNGWTR